MKNIKFYFSALLLLLFLTTHTTIAQIGGFAAYFTGEQEVPQVNTTARGTAAIDLTGQNSISFAITVNGLSGPITGAHFHVAPIGVAGPVVRNITANFTGTTATGTWDNIPDSLLNALKTGKMYLNVHTQMHPAGEIRGQLFHSAGTGLIAKLTTSQAVSPSLSLNARGTAIMNTMISGLSYHITVTGLASPVKAQFRWGQIGSNGPILRDISASFNNGLTAEGIWPDIGPGAIVDSILVGLLTGKVYISVTDPLNPDDELRGQVEVGGGFGLATSLNGLFEVPPVVTLGRGAASFTLIPPGLIFKITINNLTSPAIAAHFHNAPFGSNGPVVKTINLTQGENNTYTGIWRVFGSEALTPQLISELIRGNIYVNFHTPLYPNGEIRGQVVMLPINTFAASFGGNQENPIVNTNARGTGTFALTQRDLLAFQITVNGLNEPITGASFHYGSIRQNGPMLKEIGPFFSGNTALGTWRFSERSDSLFKSLLEGNIYVNIRTQSNPNGLIRGQVSLSSGTTLSAVLEGNQEIPAPVNATGKGIAALQLTPSGLVYDITVNGLTGPITGAHFHYAPIGVPGPIVKSITTDVQGNHIHGVWNELLVGTDDSLYIALVTGKIYVNVHTAANPGGEIRGQVILGEGMGFAGRLNGLQETPPVTTTGMGTVSATLTNAGFIFYSSVDSLMGSISGVHFHNAPIGVPGPVVRDLAPFMDPVNNRNVKGIWRRTDDERFKSMLMSQVVVNNIYINFHTSVYPNGEVRGQLLKDAITLNPDISSNGVNDIKKQFTLNQNFPNPFNPKTTINFKLSHESFVKLVVYDILGREVSVLVNKELKAGLHDINFDASNLASGIYFYRLETSGFTDIKKMMLIK